MNINDLHQLPENHSICQRPRISLAHIDVAAGLRADTRRHKKAAAIAKAKNALSCCGFSVGQKVVTRRNEIGTIITINDGKIKISINGTIRLFAAAFIKAVQE